MRWTDVEAAWHELVDQIVAAWPELAAEQLLAIAGNRSEFVRYVAARYDLTVTEAADVTDLWLMRLGRKRTGATTRAA